MQARSSELMQQEMHHQIYSIKIFQQRNKKTNYEEASIRKGWNKEEQPDLHLDPYLDEDGTVRVSGKLDKANVSNECKHLIVFLRGSPVSKLTIEWCYKKTVQAGRGMTLNNIWTSGFWIVLAISTKRIFTHYCVVCRSLEESLGNKKWQRFHSIDSKKNSHLLIVGLISLGLSFIGRTGNIWQMRSNKGSNFVMVIKELRKYFQDMNHNRINKSSQMHGADWITWINNPTKASHIGGVCERQIRTARRSLNALNTWKKFRQRIVTFAMLVEVEAIVNSRPMTTEIISDLKSDTSLSLAILLTMKSKVISSPPECLSSADI